MRTVASAMTPFPHAIPDSATLAEAKEAMTSYRIHNLPVVSAGKLVGVLSDTDIAIAEARGATPDQSAQSLVQGEPILSDLHAPLAEVVREMASRYQSCAIIMRDGRVAGILTWTDVCALLAEMLDSNPGPDIAAE